MAFGGGKSRENKRSNSCKGIQLRGKSKHKEIDGKAKKKKKKSNLLVDSYRLNQLCEGVRYSSGQHS